MSDFESVFELSVSRGAGSGSYGVQVVRAPGGVDSADFKENVEELLQRRAAVERAVQASVSKTSGQVGSLEKSVQELGTALFAALFSSRRISHRYHTSLGMAKGSGKPLRVELRLNAPELAALPWEAMYDADAGEYLCRSEPLIRRVPVPSALPPLSVDAPPLRILGIASSPRDQVRLDVETAREQLTAELDEAVGRGVVALEWAPDATWKTLQRLLQTGPWHAVHFIGHGDYDVRNGQGILYLVGQDGRSHPVDAKRFADLLGEARQGVPQLVVLNSCSSAASGSQDMFSGTAATLARSGVRMVAAMQFKVTISAATAFSRSFYTALANGDGVDEAVRSGRRGILGVSGHTLEWLTPVLYLRGDNTNLFIPTEAATAPPTGPQELSDTTFPEAAPESQSTRDRLTELAALAGTAVVGAMATDAWAATHEGIALLFSRAGADRRAIIEGQLAGDADILVHAEEAEREQVRKDLAPGWRHRLLQLLQAHPDAGTEAELRDLVARIRATLPPAQQQWVQNIIASGQGAGAYGSMFGNVYHYAAPPPRIDPAAKEPPR